MTSHKTKQRPAAPKSTRRLSIVVSPDFLAAVNLTATKAGATVKEFVITSLRKAGVRG